MVVCGFHEDGVDELDREDREEMSSQKLDLRVAVYGRKMRSNGGGRDDGDDGGNGHL